MASSNDDDDFAKSSDFVEIHTNQPSLPNCKANETSQRRGPESNTDVRINVWKILFFTSNLHAEAWVFLQGIRLKQEYNFLLRLYLDQSLYVMISIHYLEPTFLFFPFCLCAMKVNLREYFMKNGTSQTNDLQLDLDNKDLVSFSPKIKLNGYRENEDVLPEVHMCDQKERCTEESDVYPLDRSITSLLQEDAYQQMVPTCNEVDGNFLSLHSTHTSKCVFATKETDLREKNAFMTNTRTVSKLSSEDIRHLRKVLEQSSQLTPNCGERKVLQNAFKHLSKMTQNVSKDLSNPGTLLKTHAHLFALRTCKSNDYVDYMVQCPSTHRKLKEEITNMKKSNSGRDGMDSVCRSTPEGNDKFLDDTVKRTSVHKKGTSVHEKKTSVHDYPCSEERGRARRRSTKTRIDVRKNALCRSSSPLQRHEKVAIQYHRKLRWISLDRETKTNECACTSLRLQHTNSSETAVQKESKSTIRQSTGMVEPIDERRENYQVEKCMNGTFPRSPVKNVQHQIFPLCGISLYSCKNDFNTNAVNLRPNELWEIPSVVQITGKDHIEEILKFAQVAIQTPKIFRSLMKACGAVKFVLDSRGNLNNIVFISQARVKGINPRNEIIYRSLTIIRREEYKTIEKKICNSHPVVIGESKAEVQRFICKQQYNQQQYITRKSVEKVLEKLNTIVKRLVRSFSHDIILHVFQGSEMITYRQTEIPVAILKWIHQNRIHILSFISRASYNTEENTPLLCQSSNFAVKFVETKDIHANVFESRNLSTDSFRSISNEIQKRDNEERELKLPMEFIQTWIDPREFKNNYELKRTFSKFSCISKGEKEGKTSVKQRKGENISCITERDYEIQTEYHHISSTAFPKSELLWSTNEGDLEHCTDGSIYNQRTNHVNDGTVESMEDSTISPSFALENACHISYMQDQNKFSTVEEEESHHFDIPSNEKMKNSIISEEEVNLNPRPYRSDLRYTESNIRTENQREHVDTGNISSENVGKSTFNTHKNVVRLKMGKFFRGNTQLKQAPTLFRNVTPSDSSESDSHQDKLILQDSPFAPLEKINNEKKDSAYETGSLNTSRASVESTILSKGIGCENANDLRNQQDHLHTQFHKNCAAQHVLEESKDQLLCVPKKQITNDDNESAKALQVNPKFRNLLNGMQEAGCLPKVITLKVQHQDSTQHVTSLAYEQIPKHSPEKRKETKSKTTQEMAIEVPVTLVESDIKGKDTRSTDENLDILNVQVEVDNECVEGLQKILDTRLLENMKNIDLQKPSFACKVEFHPRHTCIIRNFIRCLKEGKTCEHCGILFTDQKPLHFVYDTGNFRQNTEYIFKKDLGKGSYGLAMLCEALGSKHQFVIKKISREKFKEEEILIPLEQREICEQILDIYGIVVDGDDVLILMEFAAGGTLYDWRRTFSISRDMPMLHLVIYKLLQGLRELHAAGIAIYDIKESNIAFRRGGDPSSVVYLDWGSAKYIGKAYKEEKSFQDGTARFYPPERLLDLSNLNFEAHDIWTLACAVLSLLNRKYVLENYWKEAWRLSMEMVPWQSKKNVKVLQKQVFADKMTREKNLILEDLHRVRNLCHETWPELLNLLSLMVEKDVNVRITAEDGLRHPLFYGFIYEKGSIQQLTEEYRRNQRLKNFFSKPEVNVHVLYCGKIIYAGIHPRGFRVHQLVREEEYIKKVKRHVPESEIENGVRLLLDGRWIFKIEDDCVLELTKTI